MDGPGRASESPKWLGHLSTNRVRPMSGPYTVYKSKHNLPVLLQNTTSKCFKFIFNRHPPVLLCSPAVGRSGTAQPSRTLGCRQLDRAAGRPKARHLGSCRAAAAWQPGDACARASSGRAKFGREFRREFPSQHRQCWLSTLARARSAAPPLEVCVGGWCVSGATLEIFRPSAFIWV